jgi:hypothetical protein
MVREPELSVKVPPSGEERPRFARVGIIAGVGFCIGLVWPWLAGVTLVPKAPVEPAPAVSAEPAASQPRLASATPPRPPAPSAAPAPSVSPAAPPSPDALARLALGSITVTSCKNRKGALVDSCDVPRIESLVTPLLAEIAKCPGTEAASGTLSLGVRVSFDEDKVLRVLHGRSTTIGDGNAKLFVACARERLSSVSFKGVAHQASEYTIFLPLEVKAAGAAASDAAAPAEASEGDATGDITPMTGTATVTWISAKIRGEPKKDGREVARVLAGTRVTVTGRQGSWYRVKYDAKGNEGWVYKSAIGL